MTKTIQKTSLSADAPIDSLKLVAQEKMEQLNEHQKRFETFKSDLDLLRKRYSVRQRLIDTAAQWYGNQTLWQKLILNAEVIGIALVAGFILNTLALLTIVSAYLGLVYLFHDHNSRDAKRENDICANIVKMEQCLTVSP